MLRSSFSSDRPVRLQRSLSYTAPKSTGWIFALIAGIATLMLAAGAVIVKWTLLKPIHAEIIGKFKRDEPVFFQRHSACRTIDLRDEFNIVTFPAACLLIVLFSLVTKRVSFQKGKGCKGFTGIAIPLDFFSHVKRTFAAVVFTIFADELLEIVTRIFESTGPVRNEGTDSLLGKISSSELFVPSRYHCDLPSSSLQSAHHRLSSLSHSVGRLHRHAVHLDMRESLRVARFQHERLLHGSLPQRVLPKRQNFQYLARCSDKAILTLLRHGIEPDRLPTNQRHPPLRVSVLHQHQVAHVAHQATSATPCGWPIPHT